MFDRLIVDKDKITCCSSKNEKVSLDIEGLVTRFEVGDELRHVEHGICDVFRDGELIGGFTNVLSRRFAK